MVGSEEEVWNVKIWPNGIGDVRSRWRVGESSDGRPTVQKNFFGERRDKSYSRSTKQCITSTPLDHKWVLNVFEGKFGFESRS
jgi:hypothetical protein